MGRAALKKALEFRVGLACHRLQGISSRLTCADSVTRQRMDLDSNRPRTRRRKASQSNSHAKSESPPDIAQAESESLLDIQVAQAKSESLLDIQVAQAKSESFSDIQVAQAKSESFSDFQVDQAKSESFSDVTCKTRTGPARTGVTRNGESLQGPVGTYTTQTDESLATTESPTGSKSDSEESAATGNRVVTGLFGCCTCTAILTSTWLMTGSSMVVAAVVSVVMMLYMLENLVFFEEIRALEARLELRDKKIEKLQSEYTDLTEAYTTLAASRQPGWRTHTSLIRRPGTDL